MRFHDSGACARLPRLLVVAAGVVMTIALVGCGTTGDATGGAAEESAAAAAPAPAAAETAGDAETAAASEPGDAVGAPGEPAEAAETPAERTAPRREIDVASLAPVAIPADGAYDGLEVEGAPVPRLHILGGGRTVRVQEAGFGRTRIIMEFSSEGAMPAGYFDSSRVDSNADGDVSGELIRRGIWKMDERGNITRLQ